jgi:hypothetical protein
VVASLGSVGRVAHLPWSRRTLGLTATVAVIVPGFLALMWWQVLRALSGNTLSWAYVFEWPIFAGYAVFVWWRLIHQESARPSGAAASRGDDVPGPHGARASPGSAAVGEPDESDEELAAYNRYLAALHAADRLDRG